MRKTILDFQKMAQEKEKITFLTAYEYLTAKYEERAGIDMILVGDSLGMVCLGYDKTFPVTMDEMISHSKAVRKGAPNTFVVGDMPYMSYQISDEAAIENAGRFIKEADCDCVKLEVAGPGTVQRIKAIVDAGIPVMGHIGLTPQFAGMLGGYKAQGKSAAAAKHLLELAKSVQEAGAFGILVEGVPAVVGKLISENLDIVVLGIGAGSHVDGQLLIYADMLGLYDDFTPKFVKKYAEIGKQMQEAFAEYVKEVREGNFPCDETHAYKIPEDEAQKIIKEFNLI